MWYHLSLGNDTRYHSGSVKCDKKLKVTFYDCLKLEMNSKGNKIIYVKLNENSGTCDIIYRWAMMQVISVVVYSVSVN